MAARKNKRKRVQYSDATKLANIANATRKKNSVKIKEGTRVEFKKKTLTLSLPNVLEKEDNYAAILTKVSAIACLRIIEMDALVAYEWEQSRRGEPKSEEQTRIKIPNSSSLGKKICDALYFKVDELAETREFEVDRDDVDYNPSPHLSISFNTTSFVFSVIKILRKKSELSGADKPWDNYSDQGISDYRTERKDLFLLLALVKEPYLIILPAAMLQPVRASVSGVV